jgi:hypothetical protein
VASAVSCSLGLSSQVVEVQIGVGAVWCCLPTPCMTAWNLFLFEVVVLELMADVSSQLWYCDMYS